MYIFMKKQMTVVRKIPFLWYELICYIWVHLYVWVNFLTCSELLKNSMKYAFYPTNSLGNECSGIISLYWNQFYCSLSCYLCPVDYHVIFKVFSSQLISKRQQWEECHLMLEALYFTFPSTYLSCQENWFWIS